MESNYEMHKTKDVISYTCPNLPWYVVMWQFAINPEFYQKSAGLDDPR